MSAFRKFLGRYAGELRTVAAVFNMVGTRFLDPQERAAMSEALTGLSDAADRIEKGLKTVSEVKISKAEIQAAVKAELPGIVAAAVAEALKQADAPKA